MGDVEVIAVDQALHPAEEKGEQQGADVGAVHVGVGHDDDLVVAHLGRVELVALSGAQRRDDRADFLVADDLVRLLEHPFHVEDLALEGQDGLEPAVSPHLGGAAGGLPFHDL